MPQTANGVPYPDPTEPVAEGAARIRDVAEHVDAHVLAELLAAGELRAYNGGPEQIRLGGLAGFPCIYFGDTPLYRNGPNTLRTEGQIVAGGNLTAGGALQASGSIYALGGSIFFGAAADTDLYRSAAGVLITDGELRAGRLNVTADGGQISFGPSYDANLYRVAAGRLKTDGALEVGPSIALAGAGITVGGDTTLYRVAAGYLKTDGSLIVGGKLRFGAWAAANAGAGLVARVPIYDANETQAGYLHIYDS